MEKSDKLTGGPYWTQNWIEAMWRFTAERFVDFDTGTVDFEALGREEYEFRKALFFRNFKNSPRAREAFDAADADYSKKVANGQKGGRPRKSITADGDSANIYGDAATSDGAEVSLHRESGVIEPTTISDFSGARESTRTDGHSLRVGNVARPPVRAGRNSRCPDSREDFHAFVADNKLHEGLAEEWYAIHEAREWVDKNGNPIKDWKGALYNYCTKTEQKRRTA